MSSPATGITQFLYDGDELVAEYDAWGTLLRRYAHGDGSDDPLFWYEGATLNHPRFPHSNHQGSIAGTAANGGVLLSINTYDEYGIPGANNVGRFGYTGQAWIAELGLWYYKARIYSPTLGRFLQTDPIGYEGGINLYAYVVNDPINKTDPTGNNPYCPTGHSCDPEVQQNPHSSNDTYREAVDADSWGAAWESLKNGDYGGALGNTFKGAMATVGLSPAGRVPGGVKMALSEYRTLRNLWSKASFETMRRSLGYHYDKHGAGLTFETYMRRAAQFNRKGARKSVNYETGRITYRRSNGEYVTFDSNNKIVTCDPGASNSAASRIR